MNLTFHIYCKNKAFSVSNAMLDVITRYLNTAEIHYKVIEGGNKIIQDRTGCPIYVHNEKLWNFIRVLALDGQFDK